MAGSALAEQEAGPRIYAMVVKDACISAKFAVHLTMPPWAWIMTRVACLKTRNDPVFRYGV